MFAPQAIWYKDISTLPVHPQSNTYVAALGKDNKFTVATQIPANIVSQEALVPVHVGAYASESDSGPAPIPDNASVEANTDLHCLVYDRGRHHIYELYQARKQPDHSWNCSQLSIWDTTSYLLRKDGWTSADAAGLPILPLLMRYSELPALAHALRIVVSASVTPNGHIWPARHDDGVQPTTHPPYGSRWRLKSYVATQWFPIELRSIILCLQRYGCFIADRTGDIGSWCITADTDPGWKALSLDHLEVLTVNDFEMVDESHCMVAISGMACT